MKEVGLGSGPLPKEYLDAMGGEHEQVIDIIDAIADDAGRDYAANLPNAGRVENLPDEAVIETMATAGAGGIAPRPQNSASSLQNGPYWSLQNAREVTTTRSSCSLRARTSPGCPCPKFRAEYALSRSR